MKAKREAVKASQERRDAAKQDGKAKENRLLPPQWLDCDLRKLDLTVLGTFDVIMADPPWDSEWQGRHSPSNDARRLIDGFVS